MEKMPLSSDPPKEVPASQADLSLAEIISALSFAIDLTEGAVPGHAVRCCALGMRIACEMGLPEDQLEALYYALLLKDAGSSGQGGMDSRAGESGPTSRRRWGLFKGFRSRVLTQARRGERGAEIVRKLGLSAETAAAIYALDERWDGSGSPRRLHGDSIPLLSRVLAVAQHLDLSGCRRGPEEALKELCLREGGWFDPEVVRAALVLKRRGSLWTRCLPTDDPEASRRVVLRLQPGVGRAVRADEIDRICEAFAGVVDAKSPFTYRHSVGVAEVAHDLATALALPADRCQLVRRAALLHDLGKLAVPNRILDKRSPLTPEEWLVVVEHPRMTREILARIKPFGEMAVIAGAHHERLDGSGYPEQLREGDLSLEARVVAVADFYRALTEDRPYRKGMQHAAAIGVLREQAGALDTSCVDALDRAKGGGVISLELLGRGGGMGPALPS